MIRCFQGKFTWAVIDSNYIDISKHVFKYRYIGAKMSGKKVVFFYILKSQFFVNGMPEEKKCCKRPFI